MKSRAFNQNVDPPHPEILGILYEFGGLKYGNTFPEQIIMVMNKPSFQVHSKHYLHFKFPWRNRNQVFNIKKNIPLLLPSQTSPHRKYSSEIKHAYLLNP